MSHSRIWEKENEHCYFEDGQLRNMICSWEPNFTDLTVDDCKYAIGIYTNRYFIKNKFGIIAFRGSDEENYLSLLKLKTIDEAGHFSSYYNGKLLVHYEFVKKLKDSMGVRFYLVNVDNMLIGKKLSSFERIPKVRFQWPLSYTLDTTSVINTLKENSVSADQLKELEK
ncbi:MAG: hypothetical protein QF795_03765 [Candidatus Marinimicrobia bacterium]|jgi:hypothetical protein|nr:hypothetical protein [Candidatus Neomarinimicrobiota bacterium]